MLLLETAAEFLAHGLDRYAHARGEAQFEYKLALVSIHLGVELLMKERLRRINELYIFENIDKFEVVLKISHMEDTEVQGDAILVKKLRELQPRTISFSESIKRLSRLSRACRESAKALDQLATVRNSLVHFGVVTPSPAGTELDPSLVKEICENVYKHSKLLGVFAESVSIWEKGKEGLTLWFTRENRSLPEIIDKTQWQTLAKIVSATLNKKYKLQAKLETARIDDIDRLLGGRILGFIKDMFSEMEEPLEKHISSKRVTFLEMVIAKASSNEELRVTKLIGRHRILADAMSDDEKSLRQKAFIERLAARSEVEDYTDKCPACGEDFSVFSEVDYDDDTGLPSAQYYYGTCGACGLDLDPTDLEIANMYPEPERDEIF